MIDLFDYITAEGNLNEKASRKIFIQILNAIMVCTEKGILHGDLKEENVLIHRENLSVKMIDFGSGTYHHNGLYNEFEGESFPL